MLATSQSSAVRCGLVYFLVLFAVGFVLGTLRVLLVAPRTGELYAVLAELPVMLVLSWIMERRLLQRRPDLEGVLPRLTMGGVALLILLLAETLLAVFLFGRAPREYLAAFGTVPGMIGLAGQLVFGLIPLLQIWAVDPSRHGP